MADQKKIMVVDDEPNVLVLIEQLLETNGYDVTTANSGKKCLERIQKELVKPDLILLDIMMSGITGIDVAKTLRMWPETRKIKIVFLTVVNKNEFEPNMLEELDTVDYITKPFDNNDLLRRIKWALVRD